MQEQEGRNAGPVHERPLRQSAGPDAERATMRQTYRVCGPAPLACSRNTTHWAPTSRTTPIRPHTQSSLSIT